MTTKDKKLTREQVLENRISLLECTIHESINVMLNTSTNYEMQEYDLRACLSVVIGNLFYGVQQSIEEAEND